MESCCLFTGIKCHYCKLDNTLIFHYDTCSSKFSENHTCCKTVQTHHVPIPKFKCLSCIRKMENVNGPSSCYLFTGVKCHYCKLDNQLISHSDNCFSKFSKNDTCRQTVITRQVPIPKFKCLPCLRKMENFNVNVVHMLHETI